MFSIDGQNQLISNDSGVSENHLVKISETLIQFPDFHCQDIRNCEYRQDADYRNGSRGEGFRNFSISNNSLISVYYL